MAERVAGLKAPAASRDLSGSLDELIARRVAFLTAYQSARYARRYAAQVERVRRAEAAHVPGSTALSEAVARYLFKLMAYKDEYEVARLYTDGSFARQLFSAFEGGAMRVEIHLAPPLFARRNPATGEPRKMSFGPWMLRIFGVLARFRWLRGTPLDPFGHTHERRMERKLISRYETTLDEIVAGLSPANHAVAVGLASVPEKIRGYGHVKARHLAAARREEHDLLGRFRSPEPAFAQAAE